MVKHATGVRPDTRGQFAERPFEARPGAITKEICDG